MKALEYVAKHKVKAVITEEVVNEFIEELGLLARARHCHLANAWWALFKEFDNKWRVLCRELPGLRENAFIKALRQHDEYGHWVAHCEAVMRVKL